MLTFYPEFEADCIVDNEIILCLDCSNSMKVNITCKYFTVSIGSYVSLSNSAIVPTVICDYLVQYSYYLCTGLSVIQMPWYQQRDIIENCKGLALSSVYEVENIILHILPIIRMHYLSQGDTLVSAKKVLLLILHHLPPKCLFNIITFGAGSVSVVLAVAAAINVLYYYYH